MATRASIKFKDSDGKFIANVYHHYDGYPSGLGVRLLELTEGKTVNGINQIDEVCIYIVKMNTAMWVKNIFMKLLK